MHDKDSLGKYAHTRADFSTQALLTAILSSSHSRAYRHYHFYGIKGAQVGHIETEYDYKHVNLVNPKDTWEMVTDPDKFWNKQ